MKNFDVVSARKGDVSPTCSLRWEIGVAWPALCGDRLAQPAPLREEIGTACASARRDWRSLRLCGERLAHPPPPPGKICVVRALVGEIGGERDCGCNQHAA